MAKKKKEIRKQTWTIVIKHYDDGTQLMTRTNDGFNPIELLGLSQMVAVDVNDQIKGKIKPTKVKRKVLVD